MTAQFAAPTDLEEALALLAQDPAARPIAGGTDLVVAARQGRRALPDSIVAIDRIAELAGHAVVDGRLVLGALTPHDWLATSDAVQSGWTALADAAAIVGSPATRGTGTIGGNLMNASPAAETTAPLVVFDAAVTLRAAGGGSRTVPVAELATGPGRTIAGVGELLAGVTVPATAAGSGSAYIRLEYRRAMEIAIVGAAALVTIADGVVSDVRIALTAVAPTIVRAPEAEAALRGRNPSAEAFAAAGSAAAAAGAASPISDVRASADYRRAMLEVVVARVLAAAAARARGGSIRVPASRWTDGGEA
jgi:aerobic carbon-monoxide dehydrogenase medium subunit